MAIVNIGVTERIIKWHFHPQDSFGFEDAQDRRLQSYSQSQLDTKVLGFTKAGVGLQLVLSEFFKLFTA